MTNRINYVKEECKAVGITVLVLSTDGDSRAMKYMRCSSRLGVQLTSSDRADPESLVNRHSLRMQIPYFVCDYLPNSVISIQDPTHLGAKLRCRLGKLDNFMPFGNCSVSLTHITELMSKVGKDVHGLREGDIKFEDKMNYYAVRRLCNPKVRELLQKYVPGSEGTFFYLKLMDYITNSYLDKKLDPLTRVYQMWYSVFCFRAWRYWMSCDSTYPLGKHFVTPNTYLCAEINAHSLVMLLVRLLKDGTPNLLKTYLKTSQPCESYFKATRSFTPVGSTQSTFTLLDFLIHRCRKADAHMRLTALGASDNIIYPRHVKNQERYGSLSGEAYVCASLPSVKEIISEMERARVDAKAQMERLQVLLSDPDLKVYSFDPRLASKWGESLEAPAPTDEDAFEFDDCEEIALEGEDPCNIIDSYEESLLKSIEGAQLTDFSSLLESRVIKFCEKQNDRPVRDIDQEILSSPFVIVTRDDGTVVTFKKMTIVWLCENGVKKQSSDRNTRVTQSSNFIIARKLIVCFPETRKIRLSDWCIFKSDDTKGRGKNKKYRVLVGRVLSFRLMSGTNKELKYKIYDWDGEQNVGALCDWFSFNHVNNKISGCLTIQPMFAHGYHSCNNYVCSLPPPTFSEIENKSQLMLSNVAVIEDLIKEFYV